MAKKKSIPFMNKELEKIFKKSSIGALILLLLGTFYKISESAQEASSTPVYLPSSAQPVQLYSNQSNDNLTQLYVEAIKGAKQSIDLVIYSLMDHRIIAALQDKAAEGIPLYIVCDAKASPGISRKLPQATIIRRMGNGLTHQKILVIDDKQILMGSANLTHDSLEVHGNLVIGLENPALAQVMVTKIKSMDEEGNLEPLKQQIITAGNQKVELWELPDEGKAAVSRVIQLLRAAKKSIRVAMFTWTRQDFTQELIEASKRGVKVEAVLDRYSGKGASAKVVKMLQNNGIPVHLSTGQGLLHYKMAYIDEEVLINGSANWTTAAFKNNDDGFLVIYPLTTGQQTKMNQLWKAIWQKSAAP